MLVNGVWVGWGLGDWSHNPDGTDRDNTVRRAKDYMRRAYRSYAGGLNDSNRFDQQMYDVVVEMQRRLVLDKKLVTGGYIVGVLDLPTQIVMGFKKPPPVVLPIIFTVEGHMSNMFFGPCAGGAETLQNQGVCRWQPVGYESNALPFDNKSGVDELVRLLSMNKMENGVPFPDGTPWGIWCFSQGAMVGSEFMEQHVLPPNGKLHWRLKDFKRGLCLGNPRREKGKVAPWAVNPPAANTSGIMDHDFVTTGTAIADRWQENAHKGDMFADNTDDAAGRDKTAIAKIITENSWFGGQATIFARVLGLFGNVPAESIGVLKAIISAIMFLASNPNPHYSTVTEPGDIEWMRGVKS